MTTQDELIEVIGKLRDSRDASGTNIEDLTDENIRILADAILERWCFKKHVYNQLELECDELGKREIKVCVCGRAKETDIQKCKRETNHAETETGFCRCTHVMYDCGRTHSKQEEK